MRQTTKCGMYYVKLQVSMSLTYTRSIYVSIQDDVVLDTKNRSSPLFSHSQHDVYWKLQQQTVALCILRGSSINNKQLHLFILFQVTYNASCNYLLSSRFHTYTLTKINLSMSYFIHVYVLADKTVYNF